MSNKLNNPENESPKPATTPEDGATEAKKAPREKSAGEQKSAAFKVHLQKIIADRLGIKVSKETAWNLFKDLIFGTEQFVVSQDDKRLPLSGVGTFEVIKAGARGAKKEAGALYTPKFRFYPSTTIDTQMCALMGQADIPEDTKFLGVYAGEDALEKFAGQAVANAEWLAKVKEKKSDEEPDTSEDGGDVEEG